MGKLFYPKKKKRKTTHGFLRRSRSPGGRAVILRRMRKGRHKLTK